jgi:hypothetical protein
MEAAAPAPSTARPRPSQLTELLGARTLCIGGVLIAVLAICIGPVQDPDFWWHIRIGQWMADHGKLPSTDIFTFTVPSHVWTDHEYLTEIVMWQVYRAAGTVGIAIFFGLVTWAGFLILYRHVRRQPFLIVGLGLGLAAIAGYPIWGPRAQMITFGLTCLELYWLQAYLSGRSRNLQFFPLVMALWANLHGGWVIAFAWLGVALVAEASAWAWDSSNPAHAAHVRFLAIVTAASGVAVLATPNGFASLLYPFQTVGSQAQERLIVEWFSPDFHQPYLHAFEVMVFAVIAGFALKRPSLYEFLLVAVALALALQSVRNVALFVAAATPVLINSYAGFWKQLATERGWKRDIPPRPAFAAITAIALAVFALAASIRVVSLIGPDHQRQLDASSYPVAAADWLAAHPDVGSRMYNQYGWGGYLAERFYPQPNRSVFIFGEAALMGDDLLNEYEDVQTLRSNWKQVLDDCQIDYVVYNRGEALANVLATQPDWQLVYSDSVAVIYVRHVNWFAPPRC